MVKVSIHALIAKEMELSVIVVAIAAIITAAITTAITSVMTPILRINSHVQYVKGTKRFLCHVLILIVTTVPFIAKNVIIRDTYSTNAMFVMGKGRSLHIEKFLALSAMEKSMLRK